MTYISNPTENELVECEICLKEIAAPGANNDEVEDYVYYFCGSDCYQKWQEQNKEEGS